MGYRSDVRIRLTKEDFERLKSEFSANEQIAKIGWNLFDDLKIYREDKNYEYYDEDEKLGEADTIYFGWNSVKWYDGYEDVDFIMDFIHNCNNYAFARIGESCEGDIEFFSNNFNDIYAYSYFEDDYNNYKNDIQKELDYLLTHNKNLTKKQFYAIQEINDLLKKL